VITKPFQNSCGNKNPFQNFKDFLLGLTNRGPHTKPVLLGQPHISCLTPPQSACAFLCLGVCGVAGRQEMEKCSFLHKETSWTGPRLFCHHPISELCLAIMEPKASTTPPASSASKKHRWGDIKANLALVPCKG